VRFAAGLEYDGTGYAGWQVQSHAPSVQGALNAAIAAVADHPVSTLAAGRTDAGVHATAQVVHFDSHAVRSDRSWLLGINSNLPDDMVVRWVCPVPDHFHARHAARSRTYCYFIALAPVRPALARHRAWWVREPLDTRAMRAAAALLVGEHDFSSFRGAGCQAKSPVRRLDVLDVRPVDGGLCLVARATGFLHHMVRNLAGALAAVGRGEREPASVSSLLAARDRRLAPPTAPPQGLYLAAVDYPPEYGLPATPGDGVRLPGLGIITP
jgi:tRNA pseudouridine38-40 synthase